MVISDIANPHFFELIRGAEQRAKAVADYLTSKVPSLNVQSSGKGESEPVASETNEDGSVNEAGKAANRHVDVRWG